MERRDCTTCFVACFFFVVPFFFDVSFVFVVPFFFDVSFVFVVALDSKLTFLFLGMAGWLIEGMFLLRSRDRRNEKMKKWKINKERFSTIFSLQMPLRCDTWISGGSLEIFCRCLETQPLFNVYSRNTTFHILYSRNTTYMYFSILHNVLY